VSIDEPWSYNEARGINGQIETACVRHVADSCDPLIFDCQAGCEPRLTGAIDDAAILDQIFILSTFLQHRLQIP